MQAIFEMFTLLELLLIALAFDGIILVLVIKLGIIVARKMNWISREKYEKAQLQQKNKNWFSRNKFAFYIAAIFLIPLFLGVEVDYSSDKEISEWSNRENDDFSVELQSKITHYLVDRDLPQLCVGVKIKEDEYTACASQVNSINKKPLTEESVFEIGSISKTFTTAAMIRILDKHAIDLNSSIAPYLPAPLENKNPNLGTITWNELATHTSGLSEMPVGLNWNTVKSTFNAFTMKNNAAPLDDEYILSYLESADIQHSGSNEAHYSNLGIGFLGYLLSRLENKSYTEMLNDEVIKPLMLSRTSPENIQVENRVKGFGQFRTIGNFQLVGQSEYMEFSDTLAGAGAVNSDIKDMMTYLNNGIALYHSPIYQQRLYTAKYSDRTRVNLGWFVSNIDDELEESVVWHNGGTAGFRSYMGFSESGDAGIVILSSGTKMVDSLGTEILEQIMRKESKTQENLAIL